MQRPGWDEPSEAAGQIPAPPPEPVGPTHALGRGHTGLVESEGYPPQPLPPAGWRPLATERRETYWPPSRGEIVVGAVTIAVLAVLGVGVALIWYAITPRLLVRIVSQQPHGWVPVGTETEQYIAMDGWFVLLTLVVGILAAAVLWRMRSARGPAALVALAVAGLAGAVVAWRFASVFPPDGAALRQVGRVLNAPLELRATAALIVEPAAALVTYLLFTGFSARSDLGRRDRSAEERPT